MFHLIKITLLVAFFNFHHLSANLEKHLKKAENKSDFHNIKNIDFIYMINLDGRPEKWKMSCDQLEPYGIYPYRFSAVNGWKLSIDDINDVGLKFEKSMSGGIEGAYYLPDSVRPLHEPISQIGRVYFHYSSIGLQKGTIGIVLSHLSVLQDAYDSGYETIWVMEDDVEVLSDPRQISKLIDKLDRLIGKNGWDVLFTDKDARGPDGKYVPALGMAQRPNFNPVNKIQYYIKKRVSPDFFQIGARFGAYSMIIRRSGIKKILNFIKEYKVFLPYDMDYYLPPGIKLYTVAENVVSNFPQAFTDNIFKNYNE
jgi:GR25 family glycosyltransferase involved in LPS biosynthesis